MPRLSRLFALLVCSALLSVNAYAQDPSPTKPSPAPVTTQKISGIKLRAYAARKSQNEAIGRLKVVQSMWLKAPESNTIQGLRVNLRRLQFEMLTIDLELKTLRKAYALSRARSAVRATERIIKQTKAFERHLHTLRGSEKLSLKDLDTKTHNEALRAILGRIQTLPALPTK